ncbi:MAG TPA: hypothetical protein PLV37_07690 [Bacillota bacterium]|nr:hypothetical protein [Bacillota bacterium]
MKQLRLAMLGFGNAGRAFARLLAEKRPEIMRSYGYDIKVVAIITKSRGSLCDDEGIDLEKAIKEIEASGHFDPGRKGYLMISSIEAASAINYDVLMELTPLNIFTGQPAIEHINIALDRGRHVITANKGPVAWAYEELRKKAEENRVCFLFETTVMDGTPIFNLAEEALPLCNVTEVKGILNSTTNYILEELAKGRKYDDIIAEGKKRGFVEADPSMDVEGWDAAAKMAVLLNVLMGAGITPLDIEREGIGQITFEWIKEAEARGNVIKLLCSGKVENGKVVGRVGPEEIPKNDLLAGITGTSSVVSITTDLMRTVSVIEHEPEIEQTAYGPFVDLLRILRNAK